MISRLRPAHGVALLFLANGLSHPSLWPRFPEIRDAVGASGATFGLALLGTGVGGVIGSMLAPQVTRRLGTARAATVTALMLALASVTVGLAPSVPALFVAFALMGLVDGVADISQNALLFDVQRSGDRSLASRMHAVWSVGALAGTAIGTAAATARIGIVPQTIALAAVAGGLIAVARVPVGRIGAVAPVAAAPGASTGAPDPLAPSAATDPLVAEATPAHQRSRGPRARAWVLIMVTGLVVASVETVANEWSALTLRDGLGASVTLAGLGPTAYAGAMLLGRLFGDRAIDRFGSRAVARLGAGAVVVGGGVGLALAAWLDVPALLVVGLVVAGVGTATLFPLMLAAGDGLDASGRGVAAASLGARAGFLVVPVTVGLVSDLVGVTVAFALLPLAGLVASVALPAALARGDVR